MSSHPPPDAGPDRDREALFAPPTGTSARGARTLAVVAFGCAVAAVWLPLFGVVGMVTGSLANVKGDRAGLVAAVLAGITTIVGFALALWVR